MGIHFLCYAHGNKHIGTHDVIRTIMWDVNFLMGQIQLHVLPSTTFNSSHQRIDIVLTKYGIQTLTDIVIIDPTRAHFLPWSCITQGFVTSNVVQTKERSYRN